MLLLFISSVNEKRSGVTLTVVSFNLPFQKWTLAFVNKRFIGALLDRIIHHLRILEKNGERYPRMQSHCRPRRRLRIVSLARVGP